MTQPDYVLYRFSDRFMRLLYVGKTMSIPERLRAHRLGKDWWSEVVDIHLERFDTHEELLAAEAAAIATEHPRYNIVGSLRAEIASIGRQIDRIHGNPPGTALPGLYYWHWPPSECDDEDLEAISRQALIHLDALRQGRLPSANELIAAGRGEAV